MERFDETTMRRITRPPWLHSVHPGYQVPSAAHWIHEDVWQIANAQRMVISIEMTNSLRVERRKVKVTWKSNR
jgi:hypothetical protein